MLDTNSIGAREPRESSNLCRHCSETSPWSLNGRVSTLSAALQSQNRTDRERAGFPLRGTPSFTGHIQIEATDARGFPHCKRASRLSKLASHLRNVNDIAKILSAGDDFPRRVLAKNCRNNLQLNSFAQTVCGFSFARVSDCRVHISYSVATRRVPVSETQGKTSCG